MKKNASRNIFIGASILAIAGILAKAIGAIYKIPLTNILGANGMGVYYLVFPFYSLLLVLCSSGIGTAVSTIIAKERAKKCRKNEIIIFKVALLYSLILSLIGALLMVVFSQQISVLQGNINAKLAYIAIAPALIFSSIIAIVRAFFQGLENMFPTSFSFIIEQIVKVVFGLYFSILFLDYGIEFSVFGAVLGVTISEFVSLLLLFINYLVFKKKNSFAYVDSNQPQQTYTFSSAFKLIFKYSMPATLSAIIIPITSFFDSFMVINLLIKGGFTSAVATSLYGLNNGIVTSLVNIPVILTASLSTAIVPNLSSMVVNEDKEQVCFKCSMFIKVAFLISLPCVIFLMLYSKDIIYLLYSRGLDSIVINEFEFAYKLLIISSCTIIYYGFLQTFTAILQAINKPVLPLIALSIALIVRFILVFVLVSNSKINIFGVAISNIVFLTIASIICLLNVRKYIYLKFGVYQMFLAPIFAITIASTISVILRELLLDTNIYIYFVLSAIVGVLFYFILIFLLKSFSKEEREVFPKFIKKSKKVV